MKDIDFDELDRAVSSVLEPSADTPPTPTPAVVVTETAQSETKPEETSVTAPEVVTPDTPEVVPASSEADASVSATPVAKTPLAIKRRGQFMDVVHPSSDMTSKPEDGATVPPRKVNLQPITPVVSPDATSLAPESSEAGAPSVDLLASAETSEIPTEPLPSTEPVEETTTVDQVIPDPLDLMQAQEETKDVSDTEEAPADDDTPKAIGTDVMEEETAPATPFLADTKVDKRPLDAFSPDEAEAPVEPTDESAAVVDALPPELQADVVAVEANSTDQVDGDAEKETEAGEKKEEVEAGFNNSIPQQYSSAETKADDDHSIFDTNEYHQPLAPTKTKKRGLPGWLVALFVMLLLAGLSAAGGYFWFYYGL